MQIQGTIGGAWETALEQACRDLARQSDADPGVTVRVSADDGGMMLEAALSDGRVAVRHLTHPDEVALTLEAVTRVPRRDEPPAQPRERAPAMPPAETKPPPAPEVAHPASGPSVEVGMTTMGRLALPGYGALGGEMWAQLQVSEWSVALAARWDGLVLPFGETLAGFEMDSVGAGFLVGRRARLAPALRLDAGVTTVLLVNAQSVQAPDGEHAGQQTDLRLGAFGRAHLGGSAVRLALSVEAEFSPSRVRRRPRIDAMLPPLPTYGFGLGLGASWSGP